MKKLLLWMVLLLMAVSPAAQAMTITDVDIQYPIFPWGEYTLQVSQVTDDPALIDYVPSPAQGSLLMFSFSSLSGSVPLEDVRIALTQFELHDQDDTAYIPMDCMIKGVSFLNAVPTTLAASQRGFDLIYYLPQGVATDGASLLIGNPDDTERTFIQLPTEAELAGTAVTDAGPAETTAVPVVEVTPEPATETPLATPAEPLTSPAYADVVFDDVTYHIVPVAIGKDENGKTTVTLSGYGNDLQIRDGKMVTHVQAVMEAGGDEFDWENMSLDSGNATFSYDTELPPDIIYVYPYGEPDNRTALTVLGATGAAGDATQTITAQAEATPVPDTFAVTVDGTVYNVYVESAAFNEDKLFEVTLVLPGFGIMDFVKNKVLAIPIGCGVAYGTKVSFTEGFSAGVDDPLRVSYEYDTKGETPPLLLVGRREKAKQSKEPFAIVETSTLKRLGEVSVDQLTGGTDAVAAAAQGSGTGASPIATPAPSATARPAGDADSMFINTLMAAEAQNTKDAWARAILTAGADQVKRGEGTLTFQLRSYLANVKALGATVTPEGIYANLSAYNLPCTLTVTEANRTLSAAPTDVKTLLKAVTKAAAKAKKEFASKAVLAALTERLCGNALTGDESGKFAPLFASQNKLKLAVSGGPDTLTLTAVYADPDTLLNLGYQAAVAKIARMEGANAMDTDQVQRIFVEELTAQAATLKKKAGTKAEFTFALDTLFAGDNPGAGDAYTELLAVYGDAYDSQLSTLRDTVGSMPDYPTVDMPETGWVSGSTKGTKVIFKIPNDGLARFVQMRSVDGEEMAASAFIRPGKSTSVRVPKGMYYILVAVGNLWYGPEHLFGETGDYLRTDSLEILSANYYHTITLGGAKDGNMSSYGADPEAFQ